MEMIIWVGLGLIAGGLASRFLEDTVGNTLVDIILGVVGAVFAGSLLYLLGNTKNSVDIFYFIIILLGSVMFIWLRRNIQKI